MHICRVWRVLPCGSPAPDGDQHTKQLEKNKSIIKQEMGQKSPKKQVDCSDDEDHKKEDRHTKTAIVEKDAPTQKTRKGSAKKEPTRKAQKESARKGPTQKAMPVQMDTTVKKIHQKQIIDDTSDDEHAGVAQREPAQKATSAPTKPPKKTAPVKGVIKKSDTQKSRSEGGEEGKGDKKRGGLWPLTRRGKWRNTHLEGTKKSAASTTWTQTKKIGF